MSGIPPGDISSMVVFGRVSGGLAALVWLVGVPLVAMSSVPLPSNGEYFVTGVVTLALGSTLMPLVLRIGSELGQRARLIMRGSGLAVSILLVITGALLALAATGRLGSAAPGWISNGPEVILVGLFLWIGLASFALRGPTAIQRARLWIGLLSSASVFAVAGFSVAVFSLTSGFTWTNATVVLLLLVDLVIWASVPAWLVVVAASL